MRLYGHKLTFSATAGNSGGSYGVVFENKAHSILDLDLAVQLRIHINFFPFASYCNCPCKSFRQIEVYGPYVQYSLAYS